MPAISVCYVQTGTLPPANHIGSTGTKSDILDTVSGRARLPGGEPRKASQRKTRKANPVQVRVAPTWRAGDSVRWKERAGVFRREVGDGEHAEVAIADRVYRVRMSELR